MTHDGEPDSYEYASRLATWIWEKHYKNESPHWKPLNDLLGVLTQIDNMVTGLVRAQPEQEIDSDRPHVENDGCPTEKAVLQRFWREHHAQPEQEPVAWMHIQGNHEDPCFRELTEDEISRGWTQKPLYTAPPRSEPVIDKTMAIRIATQLGWEPKREWVGLTDAEMFNLWVRCPAETEDRFAFARAIEAKLKEKNHG